MRPKNRFAHSQRMTVINGILVFVILIFVLQVWLITATVNAHLDGDRAIALPAAVASLVCFGLNVGLLRFLYRFE